MATRPEEILRIRSLRARRESFAPIGERIEARQRDLERTARRLGPIVAAWESVIPAPLAVQTRLRSVRAGVLGVDVASSGALFEVDRLLRDGAADQITQLTSGVIRQIRLRVGSITGDDASSPGPAA